MHGRYHVSVKDIQALAKPILRHRIMTNFYAESERINSDAIVERLLETCRCRRAGCRRWPRARTSGQFLDPAVVARLGTLELKARTIVEGLPVRPAPQPVQGVQRRVRRVPAVHARRRPRDDRLEGLRAQRPPLRQEVRGGNQPRLPPLLDVSGSMGYGSRGDHQARVRASASPASLAYLMNRQRDAVGLTAFDDSIVDDAAGERAAGPPARAAGHARAAAARAARPTSPSRCTSSPTR